MTKIAQVREDHAQFDLTINDNMPEIFSDGISQLMLGTPISKVTFHSVGSPANPETGIEQREAVLRLAISTPVLLEVCRNILFAAQESLDAFSEGGKQVDMHVRKIMEGVNIAK